MLGISNASQEAESRISEEKRADFKRMFYSTELPENFDVARRVLEQYSHIPAEQVDDHVLKIRDQGWAIFPFPCIGQFRFLELDRALEDSRFQVALKRLTRPGSKDCFLDVGCFVGQVARMLAFSGVDPDRIFGTDLEQAYLDLGFELFRDEHKLSRNHFIAGDMLQDPRDARLDPFVGKMTLINASSFFHLFDFALQVKAAERCIEFLDPNAKDVMVFGRMTGRAESGLVAGPGASKLFVHNAESWAQLWEQAGTSTGTKWRTEFEILDDPEFAINNPMFTESGVRRARFGAFRLVSTSSHLH